MGVTVVKLKDVLDRGTSNLSANKLNDNEGEYPVYGATGLFKNVDFFQQDKEYLAIIKDGAGVGRVYHYPAKSSILGTMQYLFPKDNINIRFAYYYLMSLDFKKYTCGAAIPHIYYKDYCNETLALPSKEEQDKIVTILDKVDEIRAKKKLANDKLDEFLKSKFKDMFGTPYINEKSFQSNTFKDVCTVRQGLQIPISERKIEPALNRLKYITIQYLNGKKDTEYIENPRENVICNEQDILMTRTGNTGMVITDVSGVFHNNFFLIDFNRDLLKKDFLVAYLKHPKVQAEIIKKAGTSTIPDLNHSDFYKIKLFIPPLELQNKFAQIVEKVEAQKQKNELVIEQMNNLFNSLSQRAFKGEL